MPQSDKRDLVSELENLQALHASGALTDDEFATLKADIIEKGLNQKPAMEIKKSEPTTHRAGEIQQLEPTGERVFAVWWLLIWRFTVGGMLIGLILFFIAGSFIAVFAPNSDSEFFQVFAIIFLIGAVPVGLIWFGFVVRMAFRKKYEGFRIALLLKS